MIIKRASRLYKSMTTTDQVHPTDHRLSMKFQLLITTKKKANIGVGPNKLAFRCRADDGNGVSPAFTRKTVFQHVQM